MKQINTKQLVKVLASKLDLEVEVTNFKDFRAFIDDVYSQLVTRWESLDDQAYYWHNVNTPERVIIVPTKVLQAVYQEASDKFNFEDVEMYDADGSYDEEPKDDPQQFDCETIEFSYVDNGDSSIEEFIAYLQNVSKEYGCDIKMTIGNCDSNEYCEHDLKWMITPNGIDSTDCFFEIEDDGAEKLMDALYWLVENFSLDTFDAFENMGVELRYVESK